MQRAFYYRFVVKNKSAILNLVKQLSKVRIHVERVIGLLNKYTILKGPIPVNMLKHAAVDTDVANIDKILVVCAALTNMCPSVV